MKGVVIKSVSPVAPTDSRGPTYEWCKGLPGMQVSVFCRKLGSVFGGHYHTGNDPSKSPERFFIVKGRMMLRATDGEEETTATLKEADEILIYPYVFHTFKALSDVVFLEYRSTTFDRNKPDAFDEKSFREYLANSQRP